MLEGQKKGYVWPDIWGEVKHNPGQTGHWRRQHKLLRLHCTDMMVLLQYSSISLLFAIHLIVAVSFHVWDIVTCWSQQGSVCYLSDPWAGFLPSSVEPNPTVLLHYNSSLRTWRNLTLSCLYFNLCIPHLAFPSSCFLLLPTHSSTIYIKEQLWDQVFESAPFFMQKENLHFLFWPLLPPLLIFI